MCIEEEYDNSLRWVNVLEKENKQLKRAVRRLLNNMNAGEWNSEGIYQQDLAIKYAEKVLEEEVK